MKTISKALVGTVAAGAMAMTSAAPAMARDRWDHDDGIDAGDVIAGAVIIGGIAALAGAFDGDDNYDRYDRRYYNNDPRRAVERCVAAVENNARRYGYNANVTQIRDVDGNRNNLRVRGNLVVDGRYGGYDRWGYDRNRGYDRGRFTCRVDRGRVYNIDYNGIRGLR